ncbi:MAG: ABC transporter substrate-binding protein, partial [Lachnospiraceae bacterium]|nr:ABC transporter substrate-binding protein [Lachnospiraceae bacterium]
LTSGTAYSSVVGLLDLYGEEYFASLGKQDVAIESGSVALTKLETGECKEIMVLEESVLKKREEEGSSLEVIYPDDGSVLVPSPIMIIDGEHSANNNIAAAEAVEDYYLSKEGQEQIIKGWMNTARSDVESYPYDGKPVMELVENAIPVDWVKCYKERDAIRTMFQEYVTVPQE